MNMRECSKKEWESSDTLEHLKLGCLQRIADAVETMSRSYSALIQDRDLYERWWKEEKSRNEKLKNRNAGLRGAISRLSRKA